MIHLRRLTLKDRLMEAIFPELRRIREDQIDKAIRVLMRDCEEPCVIDEWLLPDGLGSPPRKIK
jgi:hypothetical protein